MRFLLDQKSYQEMRSRTNHTPDCYVAPGLYLHHMYVDRVKYVVARALMECIKQAEINNDLDAIRHLKLHKNQLDQLLAEAQKKGVNVSQTRFLGDPPPREEETRPRSNTFVPSPPTTLEETGLPRVLIEEMILRTVYHHGQPTGGEISRELRIPFQLIGPVLEQMRASQLLDIIGQKGIGDAAYQYIVKPPRGTSAVQEASNKTEYVGPAPIPFSQYLEAVEAQTIKNMVVNRRNIQQAFSDLVITDSVYNEIGPSVNSADSIFLFGFPGNGKTVIAERITKLMGDDVYIPYAIEADGQIVKVFDAIVHNSVETPQDSGIFSQPDFGQLSGPKTDLRYIKIKRPVVIVGGELILSMLDLTYNPFGKFYEAPLQMKANLGVFMIDDFGRQQVRPMDLLNRWIVPLEKRYDYLTTVTGQKLQLPFDLLLIFSTNLDPNQIADEAFLRRIKYKIEIRNPDEAQWREIWKLVCRGKNVEHDPNGIDYLLEKWYKPENRPFRMVHPRDILNLMINIAKYNMESVSFSPDLIDAACYAYFVRKDTTDFGAKVDL